MTPSTPSEVMAQSLASLFTHCLGGQLLTDFERPLDEAALLDRADLLALARLLSPGSLAESTSSLSPRRATIMLFLERDERAAIHLHDDASIQLGESTIRVRVAEPLALNAWLVERGIEGFGLGRCSVAHSRMRQRWLEAAPVAWQSLAETQRWCRREDVSLPSLVQLAAMDEHGAAMLLRWHGALDTLWKDLPECTRLSSQLLSAIPLQSIVKALRCEEPSAALIRGGARILAELVHTRAAASQAREALQPADWRRLLALAESKGDPESAERIALAASGDEPACPEGCTVIGVAAHGSFRNVHAADGLVVARDGQDLRWFELETGEAGSHAMMVNLPLAVVAGRIVFAADSPLRGLDPVSGELFSAPAAGRLRKLLSRGVTAAQWRSEKERLLKAWRHDGLGVIPVPEDLQRLLVAEPSDGELEAYHAARHLGMRAPAALALPHLWLLNALETFLWGRPRSRRTGRIEIEFGDPLLALAASETGAEVLEATCDQGLVWWSVDGGGKQTQRRVIALPAAAVVAIRAIGHDLLIHGRDPLGDYLLRVLTA